MRAYTKLISALVAASMLAVAAPASFAKAPRYGYNNGSGWHIYKTSAACERARQRASNTGAVVGGLGGAALGSAVAGHGAKTEGAIIGGVAGVLTGRQIAKKDHRCRVM